MHLYRQKKSVRWGIFASLALFAAAVLAAAFLLQKTTDSASAERKKQMEAAIHKSIVSCYAVEGQYPESLEYLEKHYGLSVDRDRFVVEYSVFASNLYPAVQVAERGNG